MCTFLTYPFPFSQFPVCFLNFFKSSSILRQRGIKLHIRSRRSVQSQGSLHAASVLQSERTLRRSVNQVSQYRMSDACHMNTNPDVSFLFPVHIRYACSFQNAPAPDSASLLSSMWCMNAHLLAVRRMSPNRCIDRAGILL